MASTEYPTYIVVGYKRLKGISKETQRPYNFYLIYVKDETAAMQMHGTCVDKYSLNLDGFVGDSQAQISQALDSGMYCKCRMVFNMYGKLQCVEFVEALAPTIAISAKVVKSRTRKSKIAESKSETKVEIKASESFE